MALKPLTLSTFLGVNNRLPDTRLRTKEGAWLASGVNVDLSPAGTVRRRAGYALAQSGTACHSLWGYGAFGAYVDGASLYRLRVGPGGVSRELVRADLTAGLALSYAPQREDVYYSNGIERGILRRDSAQSTWGTLPDLGDPELASYGWRQLPAGTILRFHKGCLLSVRGSQLFKSQPWAPNVYDPKRGYLPMGEDITLVAPLETGVFLATENTTYWAPDDMSQGLVTVLPYGALPGGEAPIPDSKAVLWMSPRGMVRGSPDGTAVNLQDKSVATDGGAAAALLLREFDGMQKAVAAVSGLDVSGAAAHSYMSAEITRKGITL